MRAFPGHHVYTQRPRRTLAPECIAATRQHMGLVAGALVAKHDGLVSRSGSSGEENSTSTGFVNDKAGHVAERARLKSGVTGVEGPEMPIELGTSRSPAGCRSAHWRGTVLVERIE